MDAMALLRQWGWLVALVVIFALIYRFGSARPGGSPAAAGTGCLAAVVITLLFFLFVIF